MVLPSELGDPGGVALVEHLVEALDGIAIADGAVFQVEQQVGSRLEVAHHRIAIHGPRLDGIAHGAEDLGGTFQSAQPLAQGVDVGGHLVDLGDGLLGGGVAGLPQIIPFQRIASIGNGKHAKRAAAFTHPQCLCFCVFFNNSGFSKHSFKSSDHFTCPSDRIAMLKFFFMSSMTFGSPRRVTTNLRALPAS